jgi:hypothetical protein
MNNRPFLLRPTLRGMSARTLLASRVGTQSTLPTGAMGPGDSGLVPLGGAEPPAATVGAPNGRPTASSRSGTASS